MPPAPSRPKRPTAVAQTNLRPGNLMHGSVPATNISVTVPQTGFGQAELNSIQKFAQLILYGIALVAIWSGILSIAFAEDSTNLNFLILGAGGIISAFMALTLVEWQRRKGGDVLHSVHDYLIGIGFFFSAVGVLWGTRWLIGVAAGDMDIQWLMEEGIPYSDDDWIPSANAIYVQLIACILLILGQTWYLSQLKGETTFGWAATTFTPLVLALVGFGPWMDWSGNIVSWELGISIISLTALAMWLSLRSNSGLIFSIVAVVSGLIPILYETQHDVNSSGAGGAMSLMVFVILVQGWLAADEKIKQELMQWTSALLVGEVVLAMILARSEDLNLILGFIRQDELGSFSNIVTLQVALWITVLLAYFPATLKRRIPYMPIGLAASLFIITPQASVIPWIVTLIMLPYLLIISDVTRNWVANWTMLAAGFSFFMQSHLFDGFYYEYFDAVILLALIVTGEIGRQKGHLSDWAHFVTLGLMILSDAVLFGSDPFIPWTIVTYTVVSSYTMMLKAEKSGLNEDAFGASTAMFGSMFMAVVLSFAERLEVPLPDSIMEYLSGFNITLAIVGLAIYFAMLRFKDIELDIGIMVSWLDERSAMVPIFDSTTGQWIVQAGIEEEEDDDDENPTGWGPLGRVSLLGPMMLFSLAIFSVSAEQLATDLIWVLLMAIPIGIIVTEVIGEFNASSVGRCIATWVMFAVAFPVSYKLIEAGTMTSDLLITGVIFDVLLLSGPLVVSMILANKGLNDEYLNEFADNLTLLGLLCLGLLDASGGLLFLTMYLLVFYRSIKHRLNFILIFAPVALLIYGGRFAGEGAVMNSLFELINITSYDPSAITALEMTRFSCLIMAVTSITILAKGVVDRRLGLNESQTMTPMVAPTIWLAIGMNGVLPEASWLLLSLTLIITLYSWLSGRIDFIPWSPVFVLVSFIFGYSLDSNFNHFEGYDVFAYSLLGTGVFTLIINRLSDSGILFKWADVALEKESEYIHQTLMDLKSIQGRENLVNYTRVATMICLTLSWTALSGIGTMIGAIWITWDLVVNGQKYALLGMPLLHAFAVWNLIEQFGIEMNDSTQDIIVGTILIINGIIMTMVATRTEIAWDWSVFEWEDEIEYFSWIDRVGMLAIAYFLGGIYWAIGDGDGEILLWAIWSIYLGGIAMQGFRDETETPWRRGLGSFGTLFSLFMISMELTTDLFTYVVWMLLGIVAFGFGILYMNRMGDGTQLYEAEIDEEKVFGSQYVRTPHPVLSIPEPIIAVPDEEESEEDLVEEIVELSEDEAEAEEEIVELSEDEAEAEEEIVEKLQPLLEKEIEDAITEEEKVEVKNYNYDLQLDENTLQAIQDSLASTPHEGFKPVVSVGKNGNLKIDFVPL